MFFACQNPPRNYVLGAAIVPKCASMPQNTRVMVSWSHSSCCTCKHARASIPQNRRVMVSLMVSLTHHAAHAAVQEARRTALMSRHCSQMCKRAL
eukprot:scaffold55898_cov18-Tisochrysis_lutea.AAC.1